MSLNREASWLAPALALHRATVHSTSCGRHELEVRSSRSSVIERRWKLMRLGEGSRGGGGARHVAFAKGGVRLSGLST